MQHHGMPTSLFIDTIKYLYSIVYASCHRQTSMWLNAVNGDAMVGSITLLQLMWLASDHILHTINHFSSSFL